MSLLKDDLKKRFVRVFDNIENGSIHVPVPAVPPAPAMAIEICSALAQAYDEWVVGSVPIAGPLVMATPGLRSGMKSALVAPLWSGWGPGFAAYWSPVTFTGPGFSPVNPVLAPTIVIGSSGIVANIAASILNPSNFPTSKDMSANLLATILHQWTTGLQVAALSLSGVPALFGIT